MVLSFWTPCSVPSQSRIFGVHGPHFRKERTNFRHSVNIERVTSGCEHRIGRNSGVTFREGDGSTFPLMMVPGRITPLFADVLIGNLRLPNASTEADVAMLTVQMATNI